jgi:glycosyltransferase involved in cell wall biosynthesis
MSQSGEPLKIVRIVARLNIGGPAWHVTVLSRRLVPAGFDTLLVHGSLAHGEAPLDCPLGPHVRTLQIPELGREVRLFQDFAALLRLVRLVFVERPDIVHTHTSKAGTLGRVASFVYNLTRSRRRRCLVVHTFHGHVFRGYFGRFGTMAVRVAERLLGRVTDTVITISPRQRDDIVTVHQIVPAGRVEVVRLGFELDPLLALDGAEPGLRDELGYLETDVVFAFVGRLVPIKDPATLIRAFALVRARVPNARLMFVGDGELRREMETLVESLGVSSAVSFLGWRNDLRSVYATLDVLTLSSISEGTPVALIEAMAAGRAAIATSVGGTADVVADGFTGILVPARDPAALADAMVRLAANPALRGRMGAEGRARSSAYRVERLLEDVERLYRSGLARKRGRDLPRAAG